jgi:hypothetical protein
MNSEEFLILKQVLVGERLLRVGTLPVAYGVLGDTECTRKGLKLSFGRLDADDVEEFGVERVLGHGHMPWPRRNLGHSYNGIGEESIRF